jgi:hypothetical protein
MCDGPTEALVFVSEGEVKADFKRPPWSAIQLALDAFYPARLRPAWSVILRIIERFMCISGTGALTFASARFRKAGKSTEE